MTTKKVYLYALGAVLLASAYPIYMGAVMFSAAIQTGGIDAANYPRYIIPYTPVCIALILCAALLPLASKLCKKFALPVLSALGVLSFLGAEAGFERIAVFTDMSTKMNVETWQLLSCMMTPLVSASVWDSLNIRYNPAFKIHFYAIALLIVLAVINVIHGFYRAAGARNVARKKPLAVQLVCVIVFIGLCILACFTAFFRTGELNISPLSAVLMTGFFLTFGVTAGVYTGTCLYGKQKLFSIILPSIAAMAAAVILYIGEMVMMNGRLFLLGSGFLFGPVGGLPLSLADMLTILASGVISYFILTSIRPKVIS